MALARAGEGRFSSTRYYGTGSFTTSAFTPENNSLLVAVVAVMQDGGAQDPSDDIVISDSETLSWTRRVNAGNTSSWSIGAAIFTAPVVTAASMTITVDLGALNAHGYDVHVFSFTNYDTSTPTGATASGNTGTDGAASITLSGSPASTSQVIGMVVADPNTATSILHGTGWTELYDYSNGGLGSETEARGSSTSTSVGWDDVGVGGTQYKSHGVALEILETGGGGGGGSVPALMYHRRMQQ